MRVCSVSLQSLLAWITDQCSYCCCITSVTPIYQNTPTHCFPAFVALAAVWLGLVDSLPQQLIMMCAFSFIIMHTHTILPTVCDAVPSSLARSHSLNSSLSHPTLLTLHTYTLFMSDVDRVWHKGKQSLWQGSSSLYWYIQTVQQHGFSSPHFSMKQNESPSLG